MAEIVITGARTVPPTNPARLVKGEKDTLITYTIDGKDQNFVILEGADPTEDAIKKAIAAEMKVQQHKGRTFKL